ncbi:MAG TPA: pitrilysin family protein [Polyangia bacterium]|nr:pitrilysin family protein [Polyangia bacterium]
MALPANDHATVSLALRFRAGAVEDPPGKAGLTALTARLMAEGGTKALDSKALLETLFPMATEVHVRTDKELTTFYTTVHQDHLSKMISILTDVVAHPRWDVKEFNRLRDSTVNDVEKRLRQGDDENLGKESLWELLYSGHPYGRLTIGHAADLRAITLEDCKAQAAKVFALDRLTIGLAGGYSKDLPQKLQKALAGLPKSSAAPAAIAPQPAGKPRFRIVEKDTASTAISLGFPWSLAHGSPDFVAMSVARSAFGEHRQFNGRLMQRLREMRGLNYGDYAYIEYFQQDGYDAATAQTGRARHEQVFSIWLRPVQNENRLFALRAALYELKRSLGDEPFSDAEVAATKGFLDGYILLFAQTDERKLGYALDDHFLGTKSFLADWRARLAGVTAADVNAAWRKWIDPAKLQIILVTPNAADVKQSIVSNRPTPMHYQKDAQGKVAPKPKELLATDAQVERFPFGAAGDADVEIVPVEKLFQ